MSIIFVLDILIINIKYHTGLKGAHSKHRFGKTYTQWQNFFPSPCFFPSPVATPLSCPSYLAKPFHQPCHSFLQIFENVLECTALIKPKVIYGQRGFFLKGFFFFFFLSWCINGSGASEDQH